jgi:hypothetical protein
MEKFRAFLSSTFVSFLVSLLIIFSVEYYYRSASIDGYWSRKTSNMLQSYSVELLKERPLAAMWYEHDRPPFFNVLRVILTSISNHSGAELLRDVDHGIFFVWCFFFAGLAAVLFAWAKAVSRSVRFAWMVFGLWHIHPSPYAFATYLDATIAHSFFITLFLFEWWKIQFGDKGGSVPRTSFWLGVLFYVRVTFQFFFFIPHLMAVMLMKNISRHKKIILFTVPVLMATPLMVKQYVLYDTIYTSTTNSVHKLGFIWLYPSPNVSDEIKQAVAEYHYPDGAPDMENNSSQAVRNNISYGMQFSKFVIKSPITAFKGALKSLRQNIESYLKPSFLHANEDFLMDAFPHIAISRVVLAGYGLVFWLVLASVIWVIRTKQSGATFRPALVFFIPVIYIFLMSLTGNEYEYVESDRYKFFLEPAMFLFVCYQMSKLREVLKRHSVK